MRAAPRGRPRRLWLLRPRLILPLVIGTRSLSLSRCRPPAICAWRRSTAEAGVSRAASTTASERASSSTTWAARATHPVTLPAPHGRDSLPRLRLLVRCQDGDGVPSVGLCLLAHPIHCGTHLLEALSRLLPRSLSRRRIGTGARGSRGSHRVHLRSQGSAALGRAARDGREASNLRVGQPEFARMSKKELRRIVHRTRAATTHSAWSGHGAALGAAGLLRSEASHRGAHHHRRKDEPFHCTAEPPQRARERTHVQGAWKEGHRSHEVRRIGSVAVNTVQLTLQCLSIAGCTRGGYALPPAVSPPVP